MSDIITGHVISRISGTISVYTSYGDDSSYLHLIKGERLRFELDRTTDSFVFYRLAASTPWDMLGNPQSELGGFYATPILYSINRAIIKRYFLFI